MVETHYHPVYCHNVESEPEGHLWYHGIKTFLKDGSYQESANTADKRIPRKLVCRFFLNREVIYKKSCDEILLRCVDAPEANQVMSKIHKDSANLI